MNRCVVIGAMSHHSTNASKGREPRQGKQANDPLNKFAVRSRECIGHDGRHMYNDSLPAISVSPGRESQRSIGARSHSDAKGRKCIVATE